MMWFAAAMSITLFCFACGFVMGVSYGAEREQGRR